jgi:hypothetical protein
MLISTRSSLFAGKINRGVEILVASGVIKARKVGRRSRKGTKRRPRQRRTVWQIYNCLGDIYFRRAYRMSYQSFWELHKKLKSGIVQASQLQRRAREARDAVAQQKKSTTAPPVPNGTVTMSVRLACALRYFAGGSPYDIMAKYGVSHTVVLDSVWDVTEAINQCNEFHIQYPEDASEQRKIAADFQAHSEVGFDKCAGCIDGILIWTHKPTKKDAAETGVGEGKFFCGRKHKFGLNCQVVSDRRGRILDISIIYGGSSSDVIAFEGSDLYKRLESGLLAPGLCLFGDNAYLNSPYMATPYPNVGSGSKDNYNYFHSQVRISYIWYPDLYLTFLAS